MIVDSSAILAVVFDEGDALRFTRAIHDDDDSRISAVNWLEAAIRVDRRGGELSGALLDDFMRRAGVRVEPATAEHANIARQAYRAYGKGRHPAALNLGDCFAYALAKATGEPLLFKGDDFARTDVKPAL